MNRAPPPYRPPSEHYENFPVASWLCPPALRPPIAAIYWFARTADDIADEGDAAPAQRLAELAQYRDDLAAAARGQAHSRRWPDVFDALTTMIARFELPTGLLANLLDAFEQDVVFTAAGRRYQTDLELHDYCRRSADPVGRLLLHLYGVRDPQSLAQSDQICTALQLINFWQDLSIDAARGRLYLPLSDAAAHGVAVHALLDRRDSPSARGLIAEVTAWARTLMLQGAPLVHAVPGRAGWELRLVVQGGLRILDKIERMDYATLLHRTQIGKGDAPVLLWRSARMRQPTAAFTRETA